MNKKPIHDYLGYNYQEKIKAMTLEELEQELDDTIEYKNHLCKEFDVNNYLINEHIDDPEFEHIIDMSMRFAPNKYDIITIIRKIDDIKIRIAELMSNDNNSNMVSLN